MSGLVGEITRRRNVSLPHDVFSRFDSVNSLATWMCRNADRIYEPLIRFDDPLPEAPIGRETLFCVHPVSGVGTVFKRLAGQLRPEFETYAFQAPGLNVGETLPESYEALSMLYAERAIAVAGGAPINLLGWSAGGHIALLMAEEIQRRGHPVGLLILADPWISPDAGAESVPLPTYEEFIMEKHAILMDGKPLPPSGVHDEAVLRELIGKLVQIRAMTSRASHLPLPVIERIFTVSHRLDAAYRRSSPRRYGGPALLIPAADNAAWDQDVVGLWAPLIDDLRIDRHPGEHLAMLVQDADVRAAAGIIRNAFAGAEAGP